MVSERPHPWALLRDRLDPELVRVAWARPAQAPAALATSPAPWMLAGTGSELAPASLAPLRGRLLRCAWVGAAPELPVRSSVHPDWRDLAADVERRLAARLAGLRLAPGCGLVLPNGSYLARCPELEVLLTAHPDGVEPLGGVGARAAARRLGELLARHRLPLRLIRTGGELGLAPVDSSDAGPA